MKQSYAHDIFLAEEIGLSVARNIKIPSQPETVIRTEEVRPMTASIINHNLHDANKWYEIKLSRNLRNWQIRCRSNQNICYSYSPTHQNYFTLSSGDVLSSDTSPNADLNAIYVMCETAGVIVEVEVWEK